MKVLHSRIKWTSGRSPRLTYREDFYYVPPGTMATDASRDRHRWKGEAPSAAMDRACLLTAPVTQYKALVVGLTVPIVCSFY